jgi:putative ABC transport system permease protein
MGTSAQVWVVDDDYLSTMGMQVVSGRNLSFDRASDSMGAVINQTLAAGLGIKEAKDQRFTNGWETFHVVGIVKDFNFESVKNKVSPLMFRLGNSSSVVSVKIKPDQVSSAMAAINATWKKFAPNQAIRFTFLDEQFARMYEDVLRMQKIFTSFSILAIFIACLGLFALSAFMAEQRKREIGIRKVLGASVGQVTTLLSAEFVKLVLVALLIASPIAWWAMNTWLEDFSSAYRISITWWMFGFAGLLVISIALITVSFQSIQAALKNPISTLRSQ